jgi:hypothetical protein
MKGQADNKLVWGNKDIVPPSGTKEVYNVLCSFLPKNNKN